MPSDHIKKLDMNEVDDNSQNSSKQDFVMTSADSNTRDILTDFLDGEITNGSNTVVNNGISGVNDSMAQNLPSDLQFLRMDSFPPVSSISTTISPNQFQQLQLNTPEQNIRHQYQQNFTNVSEAQTKQFVSNNPPHLELVTNSQFKQPSSQFHSSQNLSPTVLQFSEANTTSTICQNQMQFLMSNNVTSQNNSLETISSTQFNCTSPHMINEVSSSVNSPLSNSVHFEEDSLQVMSQSSFSSMPITHSSPSTKLINEPPAINSSLLQNLLNPISIPAEKLTSQTSNTVLTDSRQHNQQLQQINISQNQFQNLPPGLLTSVQNAGLPPGAILVLAPGQFQNPASQTPGNFRNSSNTANQFSNQQLQNQFTVSVSSSQSQMISSPVLSSPNIVTSPIQLTPFNSFNENQFQRQTSIPQSINICHPAAKIEATPPAVENLNSFSFNSATSSQPQETDSELGFLIKKLADPTQGPQIRELLQHLLHQKPEQTQINPENKAGLNCVSQPSHVPNIVKSEQIPVPVHSDSTINAINQSMTVDVNLPIQVDLRNPVTFVQQNAPVPTMSSIEDKVALSNLLEKFLKEQVQKQMKEEELKRRTASSMETKQPVISSNKLNMFEQQHLSMKSSIEQFVSAAITKSVETEASHLHVGQKRQLSPTRQFQSDNVSIVNSLPQPMDTQSNFEIKNSELNSQALKNRMTTAYIPTSPAEMSFPLNNIRSYRNVEQFSEDMTQFMEAANQMNTTHQQSKLHLSPSQEDNDKSGSSSMLRKILTSEVDDTCNSSPSPSPVSSPEIQLESPASLSSPNSALFDGNTTLTLLQKSEELNLNSDNLDDTPSSELWNTAVFSDEDSMVPPKSHKSKRNHDTHSTTFDKTISDVETLFDAGAAAAPSNSFQFLQFGTEIKFGLPENESEKIQVSVGTGTKIQTPVVVGGGESLKSVAPPAPKPTQNRKTKEASLSGSFPCKAGDLELRILSQPEEQHRARYLTEGSRGAVKDVTQQSYPVIQLLGYTDPTTLQIFIACESGRIKPHGFYQACRVCGKNSTQCAEKTIEGTVVIETEILPANDMTVSIDCVGILKLRNADVEKRIGMVKAKAKKKNNTRSRMIFRVTVKKPDGNFQVLQVSSTPILCTQPIGQPEIGRISLSSGSVIGGESLFIIGKNFMKGTKVLFQEIAQEDSSVIWERDAEIDTEFFQQQHLICTVPEYYTKEVTKPIVMQIVIKCNGKTSDPQKYIYNPVPATVKKEVPMDIDEDQKPPSFVSPVALELNRLIQQTQNTQTPTSLFQLPPGAVSGLNQTEKNTQPVRSVSISGHPGLQAIAGHDKMIMTYAKPQASIQQQSKASNPQLIMVSNGTNQTVINPGSSSQNQSQQMIVILPANSNARTDNRTPVNTSSSVENFLKSLLGSSSSNN